MRKKRLKFLGLFRIKELSLGKFCGMGLGIVGVTLLFLGSTLAKSIITSARSPDFSTELSLLFGFGIFSLVGGGLIGFYSKKDQ